MTTPINYYSSTPYSWITTPHSLIHSLNQRQTSLRAVQDLFLNHTQNDLDSQKTSFFVFSISNDTYYTLSHIITVVAFATLGIVSSIATLIWSPQYLLTALVFSAIIHFKFAPLFTATLEERFFEAVYTKATLTLILKKEQELSSLTKNQLDNKLKSLGVSSKHYHNQLCKISFLKDHPNREQISSIILIYVLARYEYLQESRNLSMNMLKTWQTELNKTHKKLKIDDKALTPLSVEERLELEETAEKLSAMIYELYEFDLFSEGHTSLLSDSVKAAYLLHLMKDPLNCPSYLDIGKTIQKQSFEREALGNIPSAQSFFLTTSHRYIPKKFFVDNLRNISHIEQRIFQ